MCIRPSLFAGLGLIVLAGLLGACRCKTERPPPPPPSVAEQKTRIQREEWRRNPQAVRWLIDLLAGPNAGLRGRAALALGRSGFAAGLDPLIQRLADADGHVRGEAVFGLRLLLLGGGIGPARQQRALAALRERWRVERDHHVRGLLLDALGWLGGGADRQRIESALVGPQAQAALSAWGVLARRGRLERSDTPVLATLLSASDARLRQGAAWAIAQVTARDRLPPGIRKTLRHLGRRDPEPMVRVWAARALARRVRGRRDAEWLLGRYADPDPRVKIEAARGLRHAGTWAAVKLCRAVKRLWRHVGASHYRLTGDRLHPVLAGLRALESRAHVPTIHQLAADLLDLSDVSNAVVKYRPLQAMSIDRVHCAAARLWDLGVGLPERTPTCGTARSRLLSAAWRRRKVAAVVAQMPRRDAAWKLLLLRRYLGDPDAALRAVATASLATISDPAIGAPVLRAIDDLDLGVFTAAMQVISQQGKQLGGLGLGARLSRRLPLINPLSSPAAACGAIAALAKLRYRAALPLLQQLRQNPAAGVRRCARQAVVALAGRAPETSPPPSRGLPDLHWNRREKAALPHHAILVTLRGEIVLELYPELAPATVATFARRAGRHGYRGTFFDHLVRGVRVEAGGRADGHDASTVRLPGEPSVGPFERGSLGMVKSGGADSAGARFFVALRRSPELDGRYTLFGRVVGGLEIIAAVQEGERIKDLYIPAKRRKYLPSKRRKAVKDAKTH